MVGNDSQRRKPLAQIKWTKQDVISKFREAMTEEQPQTGQRPNTLQTLLDRAKTKIAGKPGEVKETV